MSDQRLRAMQALGALVLIVLAVQLVRLQIYAEVPAAAAVPRTVTG